jgi:enterobactin synthetase component D
MAGPVLPGSFPLSPNESDSVGVVSAERRRELELGRMYARQALAMLGLSEVELPKAQGGAPIWPEGVVGSITHARSGLDAHIAVAVGRKSDIDAVGIDAEYDNFLHPRVWQNILTQRELNAILDLPVVARPSEVVSRWCIKEAIAKATGKPFNPSDTEVHRDGLENRLTTRWSFNTQNSDFASSWRGYTTKSQGLILAAVIAQR